MIETSKLKLARLQRDWSQTQLIAAMKRAAPGLRVRLPEVESLRTNIRRWENDHIVPGPEYRKLFRAVYAMTDDELGFPSPDLAEALTITTALTLSREGLAYFGTLLDAHIKADNLIGGRRVLGFVEQEARELNLAVREARGQLRPDVLTMAVRFHELTGWLRQDSGRHTAAMAATDRACDLATEIRDPLLRAYLLMRKSNIATDASEPHLGAALADAALAAAPGAPARLRAVILRQKANAHAALADVSGCSAAIEQSFDAIQDADAADSLASYCTQHYVAMEAAACWNRLAMPQRALTILDGSGSAWPVEQRRDKGLYLARLATAHAGAGDVTRACTVGNEAVTVAGVTGSVRTIAELRRLHAALVNVRDDGADAVRAAVASLVATAA